MICTRYWSHFLFLELLGISDVTRTSIVRSLTARELPLAVERYMVYCKCFVPDKNHISYSWNQQVYDSLGHSLLVEITNDTCVKSSMAPQACKVVSTHAHDISRWNILSRLLHSRAPHLGGMNGDVQSDLDTLAFRNGEQLEDFHSRILRLQQEIMLSG